MGFMKSAKAPKVSSKWERVPLEHSDGRNRETEPGSCSRFRKRRGCVPGGNWALEGTAEHSLCTLFWELTDILGAHLTESFRAFPVNLFAGSMPSQRTMGSSNHALFAKKVKASPSFVSYTLKSKPRGAANVAHKTGKALVAWACRESPCLSGKSPRVAACLFGKGPWRSSKVRVQRTPGHFITSEVTLYRP